MDLTILIIFGIQWFVVFGLLITNQLDQRQAKSREQSLLAALVSKSAHEYALSMEAIKRSPKDKIREMEIENDLAERAVALEGQVPGSYPVM